MSDPWAELDEELNAWKVARVRATFWLRDDDAEAETPELRRLLEIGRRRAVPICLAVIPKDANSDLAETVSQYDGVWVIQHGWCHANHAGPEEKKFELGDHRPRNVIADELARGDAKLRGLFGGRYEKVLAPPWNRIGERTAAALADLGYKGLSVFGPRDRTVAAAGLVRVNTHVDIIDWKATRAFRGDAAVIAQAVAHLRARRTGATDADEPTGLITHHLVHDEDCWKFVERFLAFTRARDCVRWLSAAEIFA